MNVAKRREPIRALGVAAARKVRAAIGYDHPTDLEIEVLAFMRGALVRPTPARGARANLIRLGERGIIGVADGLTVGERRWAIAHELGHFEAHVDTSFLGLCSGDDMLPSYRTSGLEPEANAFAAELLMPEELFRPRCDVAKVAWGPIETLARSFRVSTMAAALRFIAFTDERVALVCMKNGVVSWVSATRDFGSRPKRGSKVAPWTEARAFFDKGDVAESPQTVSASAWVDDAEDDDDLVEHVLPLRSHGMAMSLLWWKP
jgi:Zn-dependent peptidase ImmA (M78 family)